MKISRVYKYGVGGAFVLISLALLVLSIGIAAGQELRRISMDFQEAPLKDVLKVFSQQASLNFVASETIEDKKITLYLEGVTVQDALDSIMKANNLTYEQAPGSSVFVVKESGKAKVDMITKIYTLNYARVAGGTTPVAGEKDKAATPSDIKSVIENLLSKTADGKTIGNVVVDRRTNSLIVTSIPQDFLLIEETIAKLDASTPQAMIEAEIVEVQSNALRKLGLAWGNQATGAFVSFTGPSKLTHFPFIRAKNPLSRSLLGDIAATATSTTTTGGATTTSTAATQSATLGTLSLAEFSVVIKALESEGSARYLAKPKVMVLNNESAEIKITANSAVGVKSTSQATTGSVTEEAERVETGVMLKVTPTINKDEYITMTLEPEVSRVIASTVLNSKGVRFLDPAKRTAKTTVMVKDGQTIAIGGLLKSDETDTKNRTPGVSKIPLIGNLFKVNDKDSTATEIIIFITSHVIKDIGRLYPEAAMPAEVPAKEAAITEPSVSEEAKRPIAAEREAEIEKTVIKLRKKRDIS